MMACDVSATQTGESPSSTEDRRFRDRVSESRSDRSLAVLGCPEVKLSSGMLLEWFGFVLGIDDCVAREVCGNIRVIIGRKAGTLTQMMPMLHSITDRFRLGTL